MYYKTYEEIKKIIEEKEIEREIENIIMPRNYSNIEEEFEQEAEQDIQYYLCSNEKFNCLSKIFNDEELDIFHEIISEKIDKIISNEIDKIREEIKNLLQYIEEINNEDNDIKITMKYEESINIYDKKELYNSIKFIDKPKEIWKKIIDVNKLEILLHRIVKSEFLHSSFSRTGIHEISCNHCSFCLTIIRDEENEIKHTFKQREDKRTILEISEIEEYIKNNYSNLNLQKINNIFSKKNPLNKEYDEKTLEVFKTKFIKKYKSKGK